MPFQLFHSMRLFNAVFSQIIFYEFHALFNSPGIRMRGFKTDEVLGKADDLFHNSLIWILLRIEEEKGPGIQGLKGSSVCSTAKFTRILGP